MQKVVHREALRYDDMPEFMAELRAKQGLGARALELQILTAARPGEAAGALWVEFDLDRATWTIPGDRMKAGKEHRVPLAAPALKMLKALPRIDGNVFPGVKGRPLTTAAGMALLKDMRPGITAHGFRSTFRDWAAECTAHPREVIEHAVEFRRIERFADHAGGGEKDSGRSCLRRLRRDGGGERGGLLAGLAGEGVGVARIDHQCARFPALEPVAAPVDRRARAFRSGEDARDGGALVEQRQQNVGAVLVADAGRRRRKAHACDRRQFGDAGRCERGDGR